MKRTFIQIDNSPAIPPRRDWKESFKKMAQYHDDELLDTNCGETSFDQEEWE